jgi:predicted  nucleic acid-binding Zn-ribbon protein
MDSMNKLWIEVDSLKESRIRHDERMNRLEAGQTQAMEHFAKLETKFDEVRGDIANGFGSVSERINDIEREATENQVYRKGQINALKKFGLWISLFVAIISFFAWGFNK